MATPAQTPTAPESNDSTLLKEIWTYLKRPQDLDEDQEWPFVDIRSHKDILIPTVSDAVPIPDGLVHALEFDFRMYSSPIERSEHFSSFIGRSQVEEMSEFWRGILHRLLNAFAKCPRARTRNGISQVILDNLHGLHGIDDDKNLTDHDSNSSPDENSNTNNRNSLDLNNSIRIMTSIFGPTERLTGEENEPFLHRLQPMIGQMVASQIPAEHRVTALFSVLTAKAREAASRIRTHNISVVEFVQELRKTLLYEHNIQQRKVNRWKSASFADFRNKAQTHHQAVRDCIEFLTAHQKDLSHHLKTEQQLLGRLRDVFEFQDWCSTLYEQDLPTMTPVTFGHRLLTAASRYDSRQKIVPPTSTPAYQVGHPSSDPLLPSSTQPPYSTMPYSTMPNFSTMVAAFFAKTPPSPTPSPPLQIPIQQPLPLRRIHQVGTGAHLVIEQCENEPTDQIDELVNFIDDFMDEEEDPEFETWICQLLDIFDHTDSYSTALVQAPSDTYHTSQQAYIVKSSLKDLENAMREMSVHSVQSVLKHLLIDPGAPKCLCTDPWLNDANWIPVKKLALSVHIRPFRFAGHGISAIYAACLIAELTDTRSNKHIFRQVVFVLPPTPIPFLVGLQIQRSLAFDLCLREQEDSHIKVNRWHSLHQLVVNSHVWLPFAPINHDPDPSFDWTPLIQDTLKFPPPQHTLDNNNIESIDISSYPSSAFLVNPWERDDWRSKINDNNIEHLHQVLRHPQPSSLLQLFRQQREGRAVPKQIKDHINKQHEGCRPCAEHAQLPRVPKVTLPPPATPNLAVTLDVMPHTVRSSHANILVMLDLGDMQLRLKNLRDNSARTAFNAYFSRWISIFDSPIFTIVDRGSNLANQHMTDNLRPLDSQLCPVPTEAPWSIGSNERSHRFLHVAINKLLANPQFECGHDLDRLLAEVEMAWNFTQHTNRILPHFHRFGVMPRALGELDNSLTTQERIALMQQLRVETERLRAEAVINASLHSCRRQVTKLQIFNVGQTVWFYRRNFGWRQGTVARIERPTIFVSFENKFFPTHESRVRPFFGELSLPPDVRGNDTDEAGFLDKLIPHPTSLSHQQHLEVTPPQYNRAPISQLLNSTFLSTHPIKTNPSYNRIYTNDNIILNLSRSPSAPIDSDEISLQDTILASDDCNPEDAFITSIEYIKSLKKVPQDVQDAFQKSKTDEIKFLLSKPVKVIHHSEMSPNCDLQPLNWNLAIKRSPNSDPPVRHRARLVSASHLSTLRHSLNGNAPTVATSTIRALLAIAPTWNSVLQQSGDSISIIVRDVTKAYLQRKPTERLLYYHPPPEFFSMFPDKADHIWQAIVQLYGEVEAGKYWLKTFIPWLCQNVLDYRQCLDIFQDNETITLSQNGYVKKIILSSELDKATKPELSRALTSEEVSQLRSDAGKLAWLAVGTCPLSAFQASAALQRDSHQKVPPLSVLKDTRVVLRAAIENCSAQLRYIPLDENTVHIRIYTDGSFQNLRTKHSQIGFVIGLADKDDNFNLIHWHSSRAPRRPHSTEQSELMALDVGLRSLDKLRMVIFTLLKRDTPIVLYVDCETLWSNLMNETVPTIPEIGYRCREYITEGKVSSVCLISSNINPADAMTKSKPNTMLAQVLRENKCHTPSKRVFMLQESQYRHLSWIPTMKVPMPDDPS